MNKAYKVSLFPLILACISSMPVDAAVKTKNSNRSYADAYQQVNALRYQQETAAATTASATAQLPVMVSDEQLAAAILAGTAEDVTISDLDACSMIYPNGVFRWEIPESGIRRNQTYQCVSVVELRNATTNEVLATTTVAAGDSFKCNADSFPESGLSFNLKYGKVEVPADAAPTMEDVESVMNEEQKQNAGLKIAAAAIIGGVAGNMLGQKQAGDTKLLGTGQMQLIDTAIGTATGAGIMAASSYSGKVAGDTIKSTAVNAASGMVLGNMLAGASGGDSVLAISKCKIESDEKDCVVGSCAIVDKESDDNITGGISKNNKYYFIKHGTCNEMLECSKSALEDNTYTDCTQVPVSNYVDIKVKIADNAELCTSVKSSEYQNARNAFKRDINKQSTLITAMDGRDGDFLPVESASKATKTQHAYAVVKLGVKPLGYKMSDWKDLSNQSETKYYYRNSDGTVGNEIKDCTFEPKTQDADDGALVDINNQARAKGTLVGTAAGGALGGFAGYQGAQDEISQRWVSAVREYEDSLSNFVCSTGGRFLAKYNDYVQIPEMKKSE